MADYTQQINDAYRQYLGRDADPSGLQYYNNLLSTNPGANLATGLMNSDEYKKLQTQPRTISATDYIAKQNNPLGDISGQLMEYFKQSQAGQQKLMEAYSQPFQYPDYSQFYQPMKGPDYSALQPLMEQQTGLRNQAQQFQNTLEDLPQTLQALYKDTGIANPQLQRTTAIQAEPITKSLSRLLQSSNILGEQINQGRDMAKDKYNVDLQNRQFGIEGLDKMSQQALANRESQLKGLEIGANMPGQNIDLITKLQEMLAPKFEYFDGADGRKLAFDPRTGQLIDTGVRGKAEAPNYIQFTDPNTGDVHFVDPTTLEVVKTLKGVTGAARVSGGGGSRGGGGGMPKVKLSAGQQQNVIDSQNTLSNIDNVLSALGGVNTGPLAGLFTSIGGQFGRSQKGVALNSAIEQLRANFQKALSGAAVSEQEAMRLRKFLPSINDQEGVIKTKLANLRQAMNSMINNTISVAGGNYYGAPSGGSSDYRSIYGY